MGLNKRVSTRHHWEEFWQRKQNVQKVYDNSERIVSHIRDIIDDLNGKKILEVGAGTGRDSFLLAEAGAEVTVLDYADNSLFIIKNILHDTPVKLDLIKGDAFQLPFKANSFDLVFHQGLLEHFEEPQLILNENFRILKNNGLLLVDVPQKYHVYTIIKKLLIALNRWFAGWETEFTVSQLQTKISSAGFLIVQCYGEWMRPSLFYRIGRELLLKVNIELPLYPGGLPVIHHWRTQLREKLKSSKLALYTGLDIGIVGRKR
jgi:ubiquinone/menaquinone biosynthesis C-methylase UbiE